MPDTATDIIRNADKLLRSLEDRHMALVETGMRSALQELELVLRKAYKDAESDMSGKPQSLRIKRARALAAQMNAYLLAFEGAAKAGDKRGGVPTSTASLLYGAHGQGIKTANQELEFFGEINPQVVSPNFGAISNAAQGVAKRLTKHADAFVDSAQKQIIAGLILGRGYAKTTRNLRRETGELKSKVERVVRTETQTAMDNAKRETYKRYGIKYVQRTAANDKRVCPWCAARHGQVYPIDQAPACIHPNDRCTNLPFRPEWVEAGLIDPAKYDRERQALEGKLKEQNLKPNTGPAPFETARGKQAPTAMNIARILTEGVKKPTIPRVTLPEGTTGKGFEGTVEFGDIGTATGRSVQGGNVLLNRDVVAKLAPEELLNVIAHEIAHSTVENFVLSNNAEWDAAVKALTVKILNEGTPDEARLFVLGQTRIGEAITDALGVYLAQHKESLEQFPQIAAWAKGVIARAGYDENVLRRHILEWTNKIHMELHGKPFPGLKPKPEPEPKPKPEPDAHDFSAQFAQVEAALDRGDLDTAGRVLNQLNRLFYQMDTAQKNRWFALSDRLQALENAKPDNPEVTAEMARARRALDRDDFVLALNIVDEASRMSMPETQRNRLFALRDEIVSKQTAAAEGSRIDDLLKEAYYLINLPDLPGARMALDSLAARQKNMTPFQNNYRLQLEAKYKEALGGDPDNPVVRDGIKLSRQFLKAGDVEQAATILDGLLGLKMSKGQTGQLNELLDEIILARQRKAKAAASSNAAALKDILSRARQALTDNELSTALRILDEVYRLTGLTPADWDAINKVRRDVELAALRGSATFTVMDGRRYAREGKIDEAEAILNRFYQDPRYRPLASEPFFKEQLSLLKREITAAKARATRDKKIEDATVKTLTKAGKLTKGQSLEQARVKAAQEADPRPKTGTEARKAIDAIVKKHKAEVEAPRWNDPDYTAKRKAWDQAQIDIREQVLMVPKSKQSKMDVNYSDEEKAKHEAATPGLVANIEAGIEAFKRMVGLGYMDGGSKQLVNVLSVNAGDGRSFYNPQGRSINQDVKMGSSAVRTTVHELGHHFETVGYRVHERTIAFLVRRAGDEKPKGMKEHTGHSGYGPEEIAIKDKFRKAYTGKLYSDQHWRGPDQVYKDWADKKYNLFSSTEVISMGLEEMFAEPLTLMKEDPDLFDFIWSILRETGD